MSDAIHLPGPSHDPLDVFQVLLQHARGGNVEAINRLYTEFAPLLLSVVRRRMNQQLRKVFDSIDVTQLIWLQFFSNNLPEMQFLSPAHLMAFFEALAKNQLAKARRDNFDTKLHTMAREVSLETLNANESACVDKYARPGQHIEDEEELEHFLRHMNARERSFVEGLLLGERLMVLARRLRVSVKTLRRIAERIRQNREDDRKKGRAQFSMLEPDAPKQRNEGKGTHLK